MRFRSSRSTPGISSVASRFRSRPSRPRARAAITALVLSLFLVPLTRAAAPDPRNESTNRDIPVSTGASLPPLAQAAISTAIGHDLMAYHASPSPSGPRMRNEGNEFSVEFSTAGIDLTQSSDRFGMKLRAYGRGRTPREVASARPHATTNRVEYRRGDLVEWYANGPLGLEQGFTLARPAGRPKDGPITLAFALSGSLTASIDPDARGATLGRSGVAVLRYAGLVAVDARGVDLPAWLELDEERLLVQVDDAGHTIP